MRQVNNIYGQALARAAHIAGGADALAQELAMSRILVRAWINGTQTVPVSVFLRIVDLLGDDTLAVNAREQGDSPD